MTKTYFASIFILCSVLTWAQPNYTANDQVDPYDGFFRPAVNLGEYTSFNEIQLADLAAGNPEIGVKGIGAKALRPGLFEDFVEFAGYDSKLNEYFHFYDLGLDEHTLIVGFPSEAHRDPTEYCDGKQSELFANMYEPIWDNGLNGTPVNENNYYALYLWKLVNTYGDYIRFWEIWNEPGFDFTGGLGWLPPGVDGNWWENDPDPCDYKLRAPIQHYVRLLRISWEVIKTVNPEDYIVVSGTGYPAFLDAILRNTDNPNGGKINNAFPKKGGAYFDVMGYHAYPHFDGSLREWNNDLGAFEYFRHSDAATQGLLMTRDTFQGVLSDYGYDGNTYPEKLWMITEVNLPRKPFDDYIGSAEAQRNFMIKSVTTLMKEDFLQMHVYKLAEDRNYDNALMEFDLMGLYKTLDYNGLYYQETNEEGIAYKTVSDLLFEKTFDRDRTNELNLPNEIDGGAFRDFYGNYTYVLWAKTTQDQSETAHATYSFPSNLNLNTVVKRAWDYSEMPQTETISSQNIELTGTPIFLTERVFNIEYSNVCAPVMAHLVPNLPIPQGQVEDWIWLIEGGIPITSTVWDPNITLFEEGDYSITLEVLTTTGETIRQTDHLTVLGSPTAEFTHEVSGPIVRFSNQSNLNAQEFLWDFGDGTTSSDANPTHVYFQTGNYLVKLTSTNSCGSVSMSQTVSVQIPTSTMIDQTANDFVPPFEGQFKPSTNMSFYDGWTEENLADITAGNPEVFQSGIGIKSLRTIAGEALFNGFGYDYKTPVYQHYENLDLRDNSFLLDFPSQESRDPNFYCPDLQSGMFRDLYLDIWDNGQDGTPINDENPFAVYVYNTVLTYKDHIQFWEVLHGPDFDFTGEWGWLPPGEPGNWWDNNPDPCQYLLRAPIFYYNRLLRITYEIVKTYDPDAYVVMAGIAYQSFLDAVLRNTDNPLDGSVQSNYPNKGGAYFDAISYKSFPHIDGSTIYFDVDLGNFAFRRHSDAAVDGIRTLKEGFETVLKNYGYDGTTYPEKEWLLSEANVPREQIDDYIGSPLAQSNWIIKAWVESVKNNIRRLSIHQIAELQRLEDAKDPFDLMGLFQNLNEVPPYEQIPNDQALALRTTSQLLYGTEYDEIRTNQMGLTDDVRGGAFKDANGKFIYVLWAKTTIDNSEFGDATYSFPSSFNHSQLYKKEWYYASSNDEELIASTNIQLTGTPIFLTEAEDELQPPVAYFEYTMTEGCRGHSIQFSNQSLHNPTSIKWTFEGGNPATSTDPNPTVIYDTHGTFLVSLEVSNAAGEHTMTLEELVTINPHPIANFEYEINGTSVSFTNLSEFGESYFWDFGNLQTGMGTNPTYQYGVNGAYEVMLVTINQCGTDTVTQSILVESPPEANFSFIPPVSCEDLTVIFLDGSQGAPTSWNWTFEGANISNSTNQFPTVTFNNPGVYEVSLTVENEVGPNTVTRTIYIEGATTETNAISICQGDDIDGMLIENDTTIVYEYLTQNLSCDSTIILEIDVVEDLESFVSFSICEGDDFMGISIQNDTVIIESFISSNGCDSIIYNDITLSENYEITESFEVCRDDIFLGISIQNDTTIIQNLTSQTGCDSTITNQIFVIDAYELTLQNTLCQGDEFMGIPVNNDTTFTENFSAINGCDSVIYTQISVLESFQSFLYDTVDFNQTYEIGDSTFNSTGIYDIPFIASNGCDSIVILDLLVKDEVNTFEVDKNEFNLSAFPNPFSKSIAIQFELQNSANVSLEIYDLNGRLVTQLIENQRFNKGISETIWDADQILNGVYLGQLKVEDKIEIFRMIKLE